MSRPFSSLNSSLGFAGGKHYQKLLSLSLDLFFKILLFQFTFLYSFLSLSFLHTIFRLVCYCSMWLYFSQGSWLSLMARCKSNLRNYTQNIFPIWITVNEVKFYTKGKLEDQLDVLSHTWVRYPGFSGHGVKCPILTTVVPGFLAIWLAVPFRANGAHSGICTLPEKIFFVCEIS